jgi:hypothetical protein
MWDEITLEDCGEERTDADMECQPIQSGPGREVRLACLLDGGNPHSTRDR